MRLRPTCTDPRAAARPARRRSCVLPLGHRMLDALLTERDLFVGVLAGPDRAVWRVALASGEAVLLLDGAAAGERVFERSAAAAVLANVLGGPPGADAVMALAADLAREPDHEFARSDAMLRAWYVDWLVARARV